MTVFELMKQLAFRPADAKVFVRVDGRQYSTPTDAFEVRRYPASDDPTVEVEVNVIIVGASLKATTEMHL